MGAGARAWRRGAAGKGRAPLSVLVWHPGVILAPVDLAPELVAAILAALSGPETVALTAWAEGRARLEHGLWRKNPPDAMHDIIEVIENRTKDGRPRWAGKDHKAICLEPWAFSCWSPHAGADDDHDPRHLADNFEALMDRTQRVLAGETQSDTLGACLAMAAAVLGGGVLAPQLGGATHYFATWMPAPPAWSAPPAEFVTERFGQRFYRGVR